MNRRSTRAGFTLMELLVVLAILAVAATLGTVTFGKSLTYFADLREGSNLDRRAAAVFDSMEKDFASVLAPSVAPKPLTGSTTTGKDDWFYQVPLVGDSINFPIAAPSPDGAFSAAIVEYRIDRTPASHEHTLVRAVSSTQGGENVQRLAEGVLQMRIQYAAKGSNAWVDAWNAPELPSAVRVSLTLASPKNIRNSQIARSAVFTLKVE